MSHATYSPLDDSTPNRGVAEEHELNHYSSREHLGSNGDLQNEIRDSRASILSPDDSKASASTRPYKAASSSSTISRALVDFCLTLPAIYFLVIAFIVYSRDKTPVGSANSEDNSLIAAAALGPTIFPIAFAAVLGRSLQAIASWKIERGATVGMLEQLLGSKTVFSAVTLPISLRVLNVLTPVLILLWAISPIGGQSSRRVVGTGLLASNSSMNVSYLDTNSPYMATAFSLANATGFATFSAAYMAALVSPESIKTGPQDAFTNLKIPMIEYLSRTTNADGFVAVFNNSDTVWSSLLGVPVVGVNGTASTTPTTSALPAAGTSTFQLESSYLSLDCEKPVLRPYNEKDTADTPWSDFSTFKDPEVVVRDDRWIKLGLGLHSRNSTAPRIIYFEALGPGGVTHVKCSLATTYVESQVLCVGRACSVVGIRRSSSPLTPSFLTILDYSHDGSDSGWGNDFFVNWLHATPETGSSTRPNPNNVYFLLPSTPFAMDQDESLDDISKLDATTFQIRFAQLLNTAFIAGIAPGPITGDFRPAHTLVPLTGGSWSGPDYASKYVMATVQQQQDVLICHRGWLAVLVLSSLVMFAAALVALVFGIMQHGPERLNSFSDVIRESPYVRMRPLNSMASSTEAAHLWANEMVLLGDVAWKRNVGCVAIGSVNGPNGVQRLREGRSYR